MKGKIRACFHCGTYEPIAKLIVAHEDLCLNNELIKQCVERGDLILPWFCSNSAEHMKPKCADENECYRRENMRVSYEC